MSKQRMAEHRMAEHRDAASWNKNEHGRTSIASMCSFSCLTLWVCEYVAAKEMSMPLNATSTRQTDRKAKRGLRTQHNTRRPVRTSDGEAVSPVHACLIEQGQGLEEVVGVRVVTRLIDLHRHTHVHEHRVKYTTRLRFASRGGLSAALCSAVSTP